MQTSFTNSSTTQRPPQFCDSKGSSVTPTDFSLPEGLVGRFAIVKLWPDIKTAEDECVARLKSAAQRLGLECIEVHANGQRLDCPNTTITRKDVDFVIHLHYDTPKLYDAFSFVALWNPLKFYHEWGYARTARNLTTHDDFLSCSSQAADDHVARMIRKAKTHLSPHFALYHSTPDIVHHPSLGDCTLFYAGINWEAISGGKSRHQEVLKRLDKTGLLRIYGPAIFQGVRVWAGYTSYVKEVPFDGFSMINEIAKAGVALVLSSQAHKDSELMSNRLFESVAAGALVICDENPFARKFFGDSLLYIDSRSPVEEILSDIKGHLDWAKTNPEKALSIIAQAQYIFRQKFSLLQNLRDLYTGLTERQRQLTFRQNPPKSPNLKVSLNLLMPEYSEAVLRAHVNSVAKQLYGDFLPVLVVDASIEEAVRCEVDRALLASPVQIEVAAINFFRYGIHPEIKTKRRLGDVIYQLLKRATDTDAFVVVAPNEKLYSNHLSVLAGALQRDPAVHCAATATILQNGEAPIHSISELIDFGHVERLAPLGYGRFIFRISSVPADIDTALPYLDGRPLAALVGDYPIAQQMPATIVIDVATEFPQSTSDDSVENQIIWDYSPGALNLAYGFEPKPVNGLIASPMMTKLQLAGKLLSIRWLKTQIQAIRKQGLSTRLQLLKRKLRL
jgi:hypothetical protein